MIYLDYNATTPVLPEVLQAMMSYLASEWGNLSSTYSFSTVADKLAEKGSTLASKIKEQIVAKKKAVDS